MVETPVFVPYTKDSVLLNCEVCGIVWRRYSDRYTREDKYLGKRVSMPKV